jgi:hypothetical protein
MIDPNFHISAYGFPCITKENSSDVDILRRGILGDKWAANWNKDASHIPEVWKTPMQRKLDRAKVIAAEVCARRFPVKRITLVES